jgi:acetyl-CoA synthetase
MDLKIRNFEDYKRVFQYSLTHNEEFWAEIANSQITWRKTWTKVSSCDFKNASIEWFKGAELNISENCLDRHLNTNRENKVALIWEGNSPGEGRKYTFKELHREVCRVANGLISLGIKKGDRVAIYLSNSPEVAMCMLACARVGAVHSVIFGGFSAQSIQNRVNDCGAKLIITANAFMRGTKAVETKAIVDEAIALGCPSVEKVLVFERLPNHPTRFGLIDVKWTDVIHSKTSTLHEAPSHHSEDPLFILYTSGSTGKPKGVLHTMGGYITYVAYTHELVFQPNENDVYWCTADVGWITGHSYLLYGPLANGTTTLMFEGVPNHPDWSRFWQIVDQHQVSIFYTAPTAIRMLAAAGDKFVKRSSRKSIRTLGTVGEPINPEAWKWYSEVVGENRAPIVDTWWQTETGGILISPLAGISPTEAGSASFPLPGIEPKLLEPSTAKELTGETSGALVLARSWPGQMRGVYGDSKRFFETYFTQYKGFYFTGDGAKRDQNGMFWIIGRIDDVIQVAGHRLGTAEIESACITHPSVAESGAVGVPDALKGEALHLFIVLKDGKEPSEALGKQIVETVRKEIGPLATPQKLHWAPGLPKTRSGKIMRRILRKIAMGEFNSLGDTSTLADPLIVQKLVDAATESAK